MKVLLAEDDRRLQTIISDYFHAKGQTVVCADDGQRALDYFAGEKFDAVLLDVMMPRLDGFATGAAIRRQSDVPIIFLTARVQEEDQLRGYGLGGDDYVTKPFSLPVLYAKVEALIRRNQGVIKEQLNVGRLTVDLGSRQAFVDGVPLGLAPKVYDLLVCLLKQQGRVCTRAQLLDWVWGLDYDGSDRVVDSHIKKLRRALGPCAGYIRTVIGTGYRLEVDNHETKR